MNREEAKKLLPIIQAFAEGKTIQWRDPVKDTWVDESVPNWNPSAEYRIKPDPREVWAVLGPSNVIEHVCCTKLDAERWMGDVAFVLGYRVGKGRVVMDE